MKIFNEVQKALLDPSAEGQDKRKEIATMSGIAKTVSGIAAGVSGVVSFLGLAAMKEYPIIGGFFALLGTIGFISFREVKVLSENIESMTIGSGVLGNITTRFSNAVSHEGFVKHLTNRTWIVETHLSNHIIRALQDKKNS